MKHNKLNRNEVNSDWTLFLDRDGVINKKIDHDYVRSINRFEFLDGVLQSIAELSKVFGRVFVVTNQRGIGRGLFTIEDLKAIHKNMINEVEASGGKIDHVFFCPHLADDPICDCRKPKPGMAHQALKLYPEIQFDKAVMIGDSMSDIQFGNALGMHTVHITKADESQASEITSSLFKWTSNFLNIEFSQD